MATVVSLLALGPAFNWLSVCVFFPSFELNRILIVVLGRAHFRSQRGPRLSFAGCARTLTSVLVRASRATIDPYIVR